MMDIRSDDATPQRADTTRGRSMCTTSARVDEAIAVERRSYADRQRELPPAKEGGCGNTNRLARVWLRRGHYWRRVSAGLRSGVRATDLLRTEFPLLLPDAVAPPMVGVEFTNLCNVRCTYCTSPLKRRPQGMMSRETFSRLVAQIRATGVRRVRVVGNGEPTLHPSFSEFIQELSSATCDLELTSNWQRVSEPLARSVVEAKLSRLHISIDGASQASYEKHRLGGSWKALLENLALLRRVRQDYSPRPFVNIRVMMRPSDHGHEEPFKAFWAGYGDEVTTQFVTDWAGTDTDVFALDCGVGVYPHCTLPFKQIEVHWNGNVPLCTYSHVQSGRAEGLLLGNIRERTLAEMWNSDTMRGYRAGHRRRNPVLMPICEGCAGC